MNQINADSGIPTESISRKVLSLSRSRRVTPLTDGPPAHPARVAAAEGAHARARRGLHLSRDHDQPTSGGGSRSRRAGPEEWNRGAYLVEGAEHCGLCHTPKNAMGGDENGRSMQGSALQNWYAPNPTANSHVGLGDWSIDDIALYLKTGRNRFGLASGPMGDAITHSLSHLAIA